MGWQLNELLHLNIEMITSYRRLRYKSSWQSRVEAINSNSLIYIKVIVVGIIFLWVQRDEPTCPLMTNIYIRACEREKEKIKKNHPPLSFFLLITAGTPKVYGSLYPSPPRAAGQMEKCVCKGGSRVGRWMMMTWHRYPLPCWNNHSTPTISRGSGSKYREMSATPLVFNECRTTTDRGTLFHDTEGDDTYSRACEKQVLLYRSI